MTIQGLTNKGLVCFYMRITLRQGHVHVSHVSLYYNNGLLGVSKKGNKKNYLVIKIERILIIFYQLTNR